MAYANTYALSEDGNYTTEGSIPVANSYVIDDLDGNPDGNVASGDTFTWSATGGSNPAQLIGTTEYGIVFSVYGYTYLATNTTYAAYGDSLQNFDDTGSVPFCFLEGTQISTSKGEVTVDSLKVGDTVLTQDGREVAVKWMGYQRVQNRIGTSAEEAPVKITAGSIAPNVPHTDLYVTGSHAVMIDDLLFNASVLCNGSTIDYVSLKDMPSEFTYYHIETEAHEAVVANGLAAETFLDAPDRRNFDNYTQYVDTYGTDRTIQEMSNTRITAVKNIPQHIKEMLNIVEVQTDWADILKNSSSTIKLKQAS